MSESYQILPYDTLAAISYAHHWSYKRNPMYLDFSNLGGDCTNFISQCLYAGSHKMNYTPVTGWFYNDAYERSASWTGVHFLHKFLTTNTSYGPFGKEVPLTHIVPGDIIQLGNEEKGFYHSLIVVDMGEVPTYQNVLIATHSLDADYKPLSAFDFATARFIHIEGVRF